MIDHTIGSDWPPICNERLGQMKRARHRWADERSDEPERD